MRACLVIFCLMSSGCGDEAPGPSACEGLDNIASFEPRDVEAKFQTWRGDGVIDLFLAAQWRVDPRLYLFLNVDWVRAVVTQENDVSRLASDPERYGVWIDCWARGHGHGRDFTAVAGNLAFEAFDAVSSAGSFIVRLNDLLFVKPGASLSELRIGDAVLRGSFPSS